MTEQIEYLKEILLKTFINEIKSCTYSRDVNNLKYTWGQYGWTGPFTYLKEYYEYDKRDRPYDMLNVIENLWNTVD